MVEFFATAAKGTEGALRDELRELRFRGVRATRGGVHFAGDFRDMARACLWSRIAVRILVPVGQFPVRDADGFYEGVRNLDLGDHLTPDTTLAVRATGEAPGLQNSMFVAQLTKDALVDTVRSKTGRRPNVDPHDPDVHVFVHLAKNTASVYLDAGGFALHRRGYRQVAGEAPLKETLAAAIVRLSGWDRRSPFLDPMAGSGTLALEAAQWATGRAPGLVHERFGFERWASYDEALRQSVLDVRREAEATFDAKRLPDICASDIHPTMVQALETNAQSAGLPIKVRQKDLRTYQRWAPDGHVVTNPPYGERLQGGPGFYEAMGASLRRLGCQSVTMLASSPEMDAAMETRAVRWLALFNGPIECRLFTYHLRPSQGQADLAVAF